MCLASAWLYECLHELVCMWVRMCMRLNVLPVYVCVRVFPCVCVLYLFLGIICTTSRQSKLLWERRERERARGAVKGFYRCVGNRVVKGKGRAVELVSNGFLCGNQHRIASDVVSADMCGWRWQTSPTFLTLSSPSLSLHAWQTFRAMFFAPLNWRHQFRTRQRQCTNNALYNAEQEVGKERGEGGRKGGISMADICFFFASLWQSCNNASKIGLKFGYKRAKLTWLVKD